LLLPIEGGWFREKYRLALTRDWQIGICEVCGLLPVGKLVNVKGGYFPEQQSDSLGAFASCIDSIKKAKGC
jgi:hypothetical protein